jgi:hypothetical protein
VIVGNTIKFQKASKLTPSIAECCDQQTLLFIKKTVSGRFVVYHKEIREMEMKGSIKTSIRPSLHLKRESENNERLLANVEFDLTE